MRPHCWLWLALSMCLVPASSAAGDWKPTLAAPDRERPVDGIPPELPEYWRLMNDILLLAFRTDSTRIATMKYCNDASTIVHNHLGIRDNHHYLAHTQPESLIALNQFFMSQLAYLCEKMAAVQEGERTLLDNTAIMHCSSMLHGNHDSKQLPVILLGGAGGRLKKDRSANGTSASVGRSARTMRSNSRDWPGWMRRSLRGAEELPIHAQGQI